VELWQSLLVAFGGNAALLLVLGFLGRSLISTVLEKDVENFKAALQQAAVEHQIRFSKLHEKRAEVLAELYRLLVAAYWEVSEFTSPLQVGDPDRKKQYASAINAVASYFRFFDQHRIWLPPALCDPLEAFARQLRTPTINLGVYLQIERPTDKTLAEQSEVWDRAWGAVNDDVPKLRLAIETEFRNLLGAGSGKENQSALAESAGE
jgi:hypothetical protein